MIIAEQNHKIKHFCRNRLIVVRKEGKDESFPSIMRLFLQGFRLLEVTLQQALEALAVAGLVASDLMNDKSLRDLGLHKSISYRELIIVEASTKFNSFFL